VSIVEMAVEMAVEFDQAVVSRVCNALADLELTVFLLSSAEFCFPDSG
jgi:hypothetical protein